MTIHHHPSDALLVDYASGAMRPAQALVLAAHVHACPRCRSHVRAAEAAGGALLEELAAAPMTPEALALAMARLDRPEPASPTAARPTGVAAPEDWIAVPDEVAAAVRRRRWVAPGVWVAQVFKSRPDEPLSYLLRVGGGMRMPQHTHQGTELTLVLKGAFVDESTRYEAGDLAEVDGEVEHSPHITAEGECVCLVASDRPLVVRGVIARAVQKLAGI
ncbi:ChrR family anti-sigma-E factor [Caulobacter sp. 17J80-11]|uniref:ChrR family anti-sigma-E factor n=1 Tax=Caulobacter sp. 17J80-11 TaxID=2763502 RepID=UPI0016535BB2|nr:ChrR family anti-sigma-E factor [Caulobacter sp. 17J80-11]MBC6982599.1 cupin domain-containing protein [Caulobacter sp. 17J80-11]